MNTLVDIVRMLTVQGALWGLYLGLPGWALWNRMRGDFVLRMTTAFTAGIATQVLLGFLWMMAIKRPAPWQSVLYIAVWFAVGLVSRATDRGRRDAAGPGRADLRRRTVGAWGFILLVSVAVRLLHPLETWALGQADAYTHLAMFREILSAGRLSYAAYPPGYAWVMILPSAVFAIDPYYVARFGGAMFGLALLPAVYCFLHRGGGDRTAGLFAAALAGFFPGLALLQKTGIGCFANQAGLMLMPIVWAGVLLLLRPTERVSGALMVAAALLALAFTVPMMLLHVGLVAASFLAAHTLRSRAWPRAWLWRAAVAVGLLAFAAGAVLSVLGANELNAMAYILTRGSEAGVWLEQDVPAGFLWWRALLLDFFRIKRWGVGSAILNTAFLGIAAGFLVVLGIGYRQARPAWMLLGCWGGLSLLQTATGVLQFTAYQREGWSLMVALACLGGLITAECWRREARLRPLILAAMVFCAGWSLWYPPAHARTNSVAEEHLVRIARMLSGYPDLSVDPHPDADVEIVRRCLLRPSASREPLWVMTRPFPQEHMLSAVAGPNAHLRFSGNDVWLRYAQDAATAEHLLLLLEPPEAVLPEPPQLFSAVSPESAEAFARSQRYSYAFAGTLAEWAESLPPETWQVERCALTGPLGAWYLRPRTAAMDDVP